MMDTAVTPAPPCRPTSRLVALIALAAATLGVVLSGCGGDDKPATMVGYALQPPTVVKDLSLPDATSGSPFAYQAPAGQVIIAYFGYTNCPDVCPTSLAAIKQALIRIGADRAAKVRVAMATVDPSRDTGDVLTPYVQSFVANGSALRTTTDADLRKVADRFGVEYSVTTTAEGKIEVVHTGSMYIVDDQGVIADVLAFGVSPADIANDLTILLDRTG